MNGISEYNIFPLFIVIPIIIIIIVYKIISKSALYRGAVGEKRVINQLNNLDKNKYKVLNNILLKYGQTTSQIDHLVISIFGIFIIETKNYSGWIFGNEKSEYWTKINYRYKSKFRNPVKQNWSHVYILKNILVDFKNIKYQPLVVFSGNAELQSINSSMPVTYVELLYQNIIDRSNLQCLDLDKINQIECIISKYAINNNLKNKRTHINNINLAINKKQNDISTFRCPKCGNSLVLRNGPYGDFWGCSNYPNCHFTRNNQ